MKGISAGLLAAVALVTFTAPTVYANDNIAGTGNELAQFCSEQNHIADNTSWAWCIAFVNGMMEGFEKGAIAVMLIDDPKHSSANAVSRYNKEFKICVPDDSTRQQQALVVSKYLSDHPEKLNDNDIYLILDAYLAAWPCRSGK
ncbi:MAG TPA: Rap1a/Tai family immunity protein [Gammaproteobacteria bacterium]|jgi:hypothetical protein